MADWFNHRLGTIGNHLKDAQHNLDEKISAVTSCIQEVENMVANLEIVVTMTQENSKNTIATMNHTMQDMNLQADQHLVNVGKQLNHVTATISETWQYYESQIKSYCKQEEEYLKEIIAEVHQAKTWSTT
jgi:septal ring factor EnvC (AmiA/AmiB activator)